MSISVTVSCDNCGSEFPTETSMELPPYWMGVQIAVSNSSGTIVGNDLFVHLCSPKCLSEFAKGSMVKEKIMLADKEQPRKKSDNDDDDEDEDGNITGDT